MKTLSGTFAFKIAIVGAVLGSAALAVRLFAQENCPDGTAITTTYVLEFKKPARLKTPDDGSDMFANFGKALNVADADGKNGTCVLIKPFDDSDKIKAPPFDNIRTAASVKAKNTPVADGSSHVTQATATETIKETLASAHVTQRVATNSPAGLAKVLACFEEPPPEKPAATPKPSPSATPGRPNK